MKTMDNRTAIKLLFIIFLSVICIDSLIQDQNNVVHVEALDTSILTDLEINDLTVKNGETYVIQDKAVSLLGDIIVEGGGTLRIINSIIRTEGTGWGDNSIQIASDSDLVIDNSQIINYGEGTLQIRSEGNVEVVNSNGDCYFSSYSDSKITLTSSTFGTIHWGNPSKVVLINSTIQEFSIIFGSELRTILEINSLSDFHWLSNIRVQWEISFLL